MEVASLTGDAVGTVGSLRSVETVLRVLRRMTSLRVALVARVTDAEWEACAVLDEAGFGLAPGDTLDIGHTY